MKRTPGGIEGNASSAAYPCTVREALQLLWEADGYPRLGNGDCRTADLLEAEALTKAAKAMPTPGDPPEFARWLSYLLQPKITNDERDKVYQEIYNYFEPESVA